MKHNLLILFIFIVFCGTATGADLGAQQTITTETSHIQNPDQEMVALLGLQNEQASAYISIIQVQRKAFLNAPGYQWERKLAIYEETVRQLSKVLTETQLAQFKAYMGCLLEEEQFRLSQL